MFYNRVGWAQTYLKKAELVSSPKRGYVTITTRGLRVLDEAPESIDNEFLRKFQEFREFEDTPANSTTKPENIKKIDEELDPEEALHSAHQKLRKNLADDLLETVRKCSPNFFERLVVELLVNMGYGGSLQDAGRSIGQVGDEGIDGIIKEDRLGLDIIYIQAKRWSNTVGRPEIQKFVGALHGQRARKGVFITTSTFSREAHKYVEQIENKIILIDGAQLAYLMIDYDLGVSKIETYEVKEIDSDYFERFS